MGSPAASGSATVGNEANERTADIAHTDPATEESRTDEGPRRLPATEESRTEESRTDEGPRRLPAARRRRQLLEVALGSFAASGYHATSMEGIADSAEVSKPVLYQHFGSKAELFRELIDQVGTDLLGAVTAAAAAEEDPYSRVLAGFRSYFGFVGGQPAAFTLLFDSGARQSPEFSAAVRSVEARIAGTIGELIEVDIDPSHRELLAFGIVGLAETTSRMWLERRGGSPAGGAADRSEGDLMARRLADLVWAGLRALPGSRPDR